MADFVFNIAKGRAAELYNRVDIGDPGTARLTVIALAATGIETDTVLKRLDTVSALVAGTTDEATNTGYARKTIAAIDIVAFAPDDTNDWVLLDINDQTWTAVANDGTGAIGDVVICYNPTAGADTTIVPLTQHDFAITPDGSDITAQVPNGFYKAA